MPDEKITVKVLKALIFLWKDWGEFENITHVEVKNPVGSAIKIANGQKGSIHAQGKRIGKKNCISTKLLVKYH